MVCFPLLKMTNPPNPWGSCFDATAHNFLANMDEESIAVCHGVCVATREDQKGMIIGHAWLEFQHEGETVAMDCIWLKFIRAVEYRKHMNPLYAVRYGREEFIRLWKLHDFPGPWDERVRRAVTHND